MPQPRTLQLDDKPDLHRRGWWWQRLLSGVLLALVLAGGLGAFGGAPLGRHTLGRPATGVWLEYDRLARRDAPCILTLHGTARPGGYWEVALPAPYLAALQVESLAPEPAAQQAAGGEVILRFAGQGAMRLDIHARPQDYGRLQGSVRFNGRRFSIHHFIYP